MLFPLGLVLIGVGAILLQIALHNTTVKSLSDVYNAVGNVL